MPVIKIMKWDLERLTGRIFSNKEIIDLLARIKCEVDSITEDGEIEYEATHDRPDLYSVEGVARALRHFLDLGRKQYNIVDEGLKAYNTGVPDRPYIALAVVKDLELDDEAVRQIMQLQEKLATTYGRRRRKVSIGVYDIDKINPPIYYELRDPDTTVFVPLNEIREMTLREILVHTEKGREYGEILSSWKKYPILRDSEGKILSMPPIINSEDTKVTPYTKNVIIDATGTDLDAVIDMVTVMAYNIAERSKTGKIVFVDTIYPDNKVVRAPRVTGNKIKLDIREAGEIIGLKLVPEHVVVLLNRMGYEDVSLTDKTIEATAPPYRLDARTWIDLVEDIAMSLGYDYIGAEANELPSATHPGRIHPLEYLSRTIRKILVGYGYVEITNYMMSNPYIQLGIFGIKDQELVIVSNPKMEKYTCLRRWLTPGILEFIHENSEKYPEIRVFEIGDVAIPDESTDTGARIERRVGIGITRDKATLTDGLAIVSALLDQLGIDIVYEKGTVQGLLPERTAIVKAKETVIGFVGEINPVTLYNIGVPKPVVVAEIILDKLLNTMLS